MIKGINFKQPKYMLPAILYIPLIIVGYLFIDMFNVEIAEDVDENMQTTEFLNPDLPGANVSDNIGSKMDNMSRSYGKITDYSAISDIESDLDSLNKKEEFSSRFSEKERAQLLRDSLEKAIRKEMGVSRDQKADDFLKDVSSEERERIKLLREAGANTEEIERLLGLSGKTPSAPKTASAAPADTTPVEAPKPRVGVEQNKKAVKELADDATQSVVVKKVTETSSHFNTVSMNKKESNMIKAIIDENAKVIEGSRIRLRILDDIEVDGIPMKKGSYLYATMSGFGKQRVKGKIESVLIGDELFKVNLNIYDTDGMEGLYVPESNFRETMKDVGSQALQGNMNVTEGMSTGTSITQWASTAITQATQRTSQAISKAIKKNKVRLKYGTQIFLMNGQNKGDKRAKRD